MMTPELTDQNVADVMQHLQDRWLRKFTDKFVKTAIKKGDLQHVIGVADAMARRGMPMTNIEHDPAREVLIKDAATAFRMLGSIGELLLKAQGSVGTQLSTQQTLHELQNDIGIFLVDIELLRLYVQWNWRGQFHSNSIDDEIKAGKLRRSVRHAIELASTAEPRPSAVLSDSVTSAEQQNDAETAEMFLDAVAAQVRVRQQIQRVMMR